MRKENLLLKETVQINLFYWACLQCPWSFSPRQTIAEEPRAPKRGDVSVHVSEGKYLKVNLVHVEGLSLMSSTMKVICLRFSWPPEGLSFTRTSRDMMGFCLNSPASRSILRATWMVPVTEKAKVRTWLSGEKWRVRDRWRLGVNWKRTFWYEDWLTKRISSIPIQKTKTKTPHVSSCLGHWLVWVLCLGDFRVK